MQANLLDSAIDFDMATSAAQRAASMRAVRLELLAKTTAARADAIKRHPTAPVPHQMDLFSDGRMGLRP